MDNNIKRRRGERRGLSTIIGSLIFVLILVSAFGTLIAGLDYMTSFQEKSIEVNDERFDRVSEEFDVRASTDSSCNLFVEVDNSGTNGIEIAEMFVTNSTDGSVNRFDISNVLVSPNVERNVTDSGMVSLGGSAVSNVRVATDKDFVIKVVTKLGTSRQASLSLGNICGLSSGEGLVGRIIAIPPEIASGDNVTVAFVVVNRGQTDLQDIEVSGGSPDYPLEVSPSTADFGQMLLTSGREDSLVSGGTIVFKWTITLRGGIGTEITINSTATAANGATTGEQSATVRITRQYTKEIVSQKLVAKPEVFMTVPSPFGEASSGGGLWGVAVVNPTDVPFTVSRIVVSLTTSITDRTERFIDNTGAGDCVDTVISPAVTSEWSCPEENLIQWKRTSGVTVDARDVQVFMALYKPGSLGGGGDDPAYIVSASVFTSLGQFSKGNYISGMEQSGAGAIGNVYLTNGTTDTAALTASNMLSSATMSTSGGKQTLRIALADLSGTGSSISSGSKLVINVPAGFTADDTDITLSSKFISPVSTQDYPDGSKQIIATLASNLGTGGRDAAVVTFKVTPPAVSEDLVYIFYCLAEGSTSGDLALGPLTEIPVKVTSP